MAIDPRHIAEIDDLRSRPRSTLRAVSPGMEARLYAAHSVLDHGFIRVIDYMGDDGAITQAARVSYGKGTRSVQNDAGLIRYLMRHQHTTPFEMCEVKFHIKLPIFVARQWIRHRTANVNEYSARYSILDREFYVPAPGQLAAQSRSNNQGRGTPLRGDEAERVLEILKNDSAKAYDHYEEMLDDSGGKSGLSRELARMNLPASVYTQWYWKTDLHNLLHFVHLRGESHAQFEIRAYAEVMCEILADWVPITYAAFEDYRKHAFLFSRPALDCIRRMLAGEDVSQESSGMAKREWQEFRTILKM